MLPWSVTFSKVMLPFNQQFGVLLQLMSKNEILGLAVVESKGASSSLEIPCFRDSLQYVQLGRNFEKCGSSHIWKNNFKKSISCEPEILDSIGFFGEERCLYPKAIAFDFNLTCSLAEV